MTGAGTRLLLERRRLKVQAACRRWRVSRAGRLIYMEPAVCDSSVRCGDAGEAVSGEDAPVKAMLGKAGGNSAGQVEYAVRCWRSGTVKWAGERREGCGAVWREIEGPR